MPEYFLSEYLKIYAPIRNYLTDRPNPVIAYAGIVTLTLNSNPRLL